MNALADEFDLIVAYPHQPRTANAQGCWNWFDTRHQRRGAGEPAVLASIAQDLAREFGIGPRRIFAAGLSAGGAMADILAQNYPDVFSAVGIHSGLPHAAAHDVVSAFAAMKKAGKGHAPVQHAIDPGVATPCRKIIFHGDADKTVHVSNGRSILERAGGQFAWDPCGSQPCRVNGRRVSKSHVVDGEGTTLAEHWLIHGGGHAWSGGANVGSFTDGTGPDASREMVRFFLQGPDSPPF